ncbi:kinase-like domain-containing protein [Gigaspora rosea]|uniref:Kinase-like domain-containing protein n=1 Tax=Gigaspora rosea TaxID=44941 RepID=A0A397VGV3_9GLOM|nr:kinase-like domain-containing protein [Gigaspora rosea]
MTTSDKIKKAIELNDSIVYAGTKLDAAKGALNVLGMVGDSVKPYVPLIAVVTSLIGEIVTIYENAQYNKKICNSLLDRAKSAEAAMDTLARRRKENEENFRKQAYYDDFVKFKNALEKIKNFASEVTQLRGYRKYLNANHVKEKFLTLTNEYDTCMKHLHFTMVIAQEEQLRYDHECLEHDLAEMNEFMSQIKEGVEDNHKQLNMIYQEIVSIQTHMHHLEKKTSDSIKINAPRIDPNQLQIPEPSEETKKRPNNPKMLKRIYLRNSTEVACKLHDKSIDKILYTQKSQGYLAILGKLGESPNILKFYGISNIENREVLVFEWAEMGTLKEVYESRDIPWITKIPIALDICRGIAFLNSINIFHHDIRCENVMITSRLEPKLANFKFARMFDDATSNLTDILKVIHWLAPEKMLEHKHENNNKNYKRPYTQKCEIFSFGMLLWELCFEKVPYADKGMDDIISHVTNGGREKIPVCKGDETEKEIQKEFITIIKMAWQHDPEARVNISKLFVTLSKMATKYVIPGAPSYLLPDKTIDYGHQSDLSLSDDDKLYVSDEEEEQNEEMNEILSIEEGIRRHKLKTPEDRKVAWKIFSTNAEKSDYTAMYWKGIYLWEGHHIDNRSEERTKEDKNKAIELFKLTADYGISEAQIRYALCLKELGLLKEKKERDEFIKYMKIAADNGHPVAMYNMADVFLKGKLNYPKDTGTGIRYLKLAALNKNEPAIALAKKMQLNIYDSDYTAP